NDVTRGIFSLFRSNRSWFFFRNFRSGRLLSYFLFFNFLWRVRWLILLRLRLSVGWLLRLHSLRCFFRRSFLLRCFYRFFKCLFHRLRFWSLLLHWFFCYFRHFYLGSFFCRGSLFHLRCGSPLSIQVNFSQNFYSL